MGNIFRGLATLTGKHEVQPFIPPAKAVFILSKYANKLKLQY